MHHSVLLGVLVFVNVVFINAYRYNRLAGLLPSFDDAGYPPDDVIDTNDASDTNGQSQSLGFTFNAWGFSTTSVKIFDTGYLLLDTTKSYIEYDGNFPIPNFPTVAPLWMESGVSGRAYHVAWRAIDNTMPERAHDLDRITNELNKALDLYPTTGACTAALIVTWKIGDLNGAYNKFQAVLATGITGTGSTAEFVLFLYENIAVPPTVNGAVTGISALVNGQYTATGTHKFAGICDTPGSNLPFHQYSNYKCADQGIYVFSMTDGTSCSLSSAGLCATTYEYPNCMTPFTKPVDSCTESVYCLAAEDGDSVTMNLYLKYYPFAKLSALDYSTFIGTGTEDDPQGAQQFVTSCQADLANPGSAVAEDTYTFNVNINPVDATPPCGVEVDTTENKISYAFTVFDPNNPEVDLDGKFIFYGKCYYSDLPRVQTQTKRFNDYGTTEVVRSPRSLSMKWIDRPDATTHIELSSVKIGRDLYSLISFNPGTPWNGNADPFGVKVVDCYLSNNDQYNNYPTTGFGNANDRTVQVFNQGCVSRTSAESFYFHGKYLVDPAYDTKGLEWRLVSGKMDAAIFNTADKTLWMKCVIEFCTYLSDTTCNDNCSARKKRAITVNTTVTGQETLSVVLNVEQDEQPAIQQPSDKMTGTDTNDCVTMTTAIIVIVVLIVLLLICFIAAVVVGMVLLKSRNKRRRKM